MQALTALRDEQADPIARSRAAQVLLAAAPRQRQASLAWWDIPGKVSRGQEIARDELAAHRGHHNDLEDARRHAHWSRRMAQELGPVFATAVGAGHEVTGLIEGEPLAEAIMDMRNNAVGVNSQFAGRPIDERRLQARPGAALFGPTGIGGDRYGAR